MGNEGSYFGFRSPQQQVDMHAGSKTLSLSICIYFYFTCSRTPKRSMIHFSKPLLCVMLICSDRSDWSYLNLFVPVKQRLWAQYCIVYSVTGGKPQFLPLRKQHLVAKNEFAFSFRPMKKTLKWVGNMLMFHVDVSMNGLDSFWSRLFLLRDPACVPMCILSTWCVTKMTNFT